MSDFRGEEKSVTQRVFEFVIRSGRPVRSREIATAVGASSLSAVTYALTRLVREGALQRVSYGEYMAPVESDGVEIRTPLDPFFQDKRLSTIFEAIRPALSFQDLSFLYNVVLSAMRLAPDLFRSHGESQTSSHDLTSEQGRVRDSRRQDQDVAPSHS